MSHPDGNCQDVQVTLRGFEPQDEIACNSSNNSKSTEQRNADSDALSDDLQRMLTVWPELPDPIRQAIISLVDANIPSRQKTS